MRDFEDSEIVEAARIIARAIDRLGNADAATPMGGLEALGKHLGGKLEDFISPIEAVAEAIENLASSVADLKGGEP